MAKDIIFKGPLTCGEGPLWVPTERALYFVDIDSCKLYRYSEEKEEISN